MPAADSRASVPAVFPGDNRPGSTPPIGHMTPPRRHGFGDARVHSVDYRDYRNSRTGSVAGVPKRPRFCPVARRAGGNALGTAKKVFRSGPVLSLSTGSAGSA